MNRATKEKRALQRKINTDLEQFLESGGKIQEIPRGLSGYDPDNGRMFKIRRSS